MLHRATREPAFSAGICIVLKLEEDLTLNEQRRMCMEAFVDM